MEKEIIERVNKVADYVIKSKETIRKTAKVFDVSKSTIHKDLKERLPYIDKQKYTLVSKIMLNHLAIRHINGGEATKRLFLKKKAL